MAGTLAMTELSGQILDNRRIGSIYRRLFSIAVWTLILGLVGSAGAFPLNVDIGSTFPSDQRVKPGWQEFSAGHAVGCESRIFDVDGLAIGVEICIGNNNTAGYRNYYPGGDLGGDMVYPDSPSSHIVECSVILTLSNLPTQDYSLVSYHNDSKSTHDPHGPINVTVSGAVSDFANDLDVAQTRNMTDDVNLGQSVVTFTATGAGDVVVTYAPVSNIGDDPRAVLSGFELGPSGTTVQFESAASSDAENVSPAVVWVRLSSPVDETVTVDYAVTGGTATAGVDYVLEDGTLSFEAGQRRWSIEIIVIDDGVAEDDETIELTLSNPTGADVTLGANTQHTYTIVDMTPSVSFDEAQSQVPENASPANITFSLSCASTHTVTVDYAVTGGTAIGGGMDYILEDGTLSFDAGQTSGVISIAIIDDDINETNETIEITLSEPNNAGLGTVRQHTLTIIPPVAELFFRGDLNCDCSVDFNDLSIFAGQWLNAQGDCSGSAANCANLDGINGIDMIDFALLANNWLKIGSLLVIILPQEAIDIGAAWQIEGSDTWYPSGYILCLQYGTYIIKFEPIPGWNEPNDITVEIDDNETVTGTYSRQLGSLEVDIYPQEAVDANAGWCVLGSQTWRESGYVERGLPVGPVVVEFKPIPHWTTPAPQMVQILDGPTTTASGTYTPIDYSQLVINEFMAKNDGFIKDSAGDYHDWIEIYNCGNVAIDMAGMYLTDDLHDPSSEWWQIPFGSPSETTVDANGYLLLWADDEVDEGVLHATFKLSAGGEEIGLYDPSLNLIDSVFFSPQNGDESYGRVTDCNFTWRVFGCEGCPPPTPGGPNGSEPVDVIINEIMYHSSTERDSDLKDYIELYNRGCCSVDLSGWRFSDGVDFSFPPATMLEPDEYLVVAADVNMFGAKYPDVNNVVGGWGGRLSNRGEKIELVDSSEVVMDWLRYADEGDWSYRVPGPNDRGHYGWVWPDDHDGDGNSLELINPAMPGEYGQNWSASVPPGGGTPGRANSVISNDIAPLILDVEHWPAIPRSSDSVVVSARLIDELSSGVTAKVYYRVDGSASFTTVDMYDDGLHQDGDAGDGVYGVDLPAQSDGTVVELYVEARDAGGHVRTWPAPTRPSGEQLTNMVYQVNDSFDPNWVPGSQPIYYLVLTEAERAELWDIGNSPYELNEDQSNAQMNATFISVDGTDIKVRYNVGVRNRGHGSRHEPPMNYRVNLVHEHPWKDVTAVNLNSKFAHLQWLGSATFKMAGMAAPDAIIIQVRVNGRNLILRDSRAHGSYVHYEEKNSEWAENHFPDDDDGNIYRCIRDGQQADLRYEGPDPDAYRDTYFKKSNEEIDDWNDLINLCYVLNNAPDETYLEDVSEVINLQQWMRYLALDTLLLNCESGLNTGLGDDYALYCGVEDPRFIFVPHDQDTYLIQGDHKECTETHDIFTFAQVDGLYRLLNHPDTVPLYYQAFCDLFLMVYNPQVMYPLMQEYLGGYLPQSIIDDMNDAVVGRREYVLSQIPQQLTIDCNLSVVNGYYLNTDGWSVLLDGQSHAAKTRSVLVNGVEAEWDARYAIWSLDTLPLNPGINRVVVEAFDGRGGSGDEIERDYIDIWYDDGSEEVICGPLTDATTVLDAASGPWHVICSLVVPTGKTLQIEAGTTLFFDSGVGITVNGRIVAEGGEYQRIRFTRVPGSGSSWGRIYFDSSQEDSQLRCVDMDYGGAMDISSSQVLIDNVTWANVNRTILEVSNPSLIVRNSVFPPVSSETIHGGGMPANGYFILEDNTFGKVSGNKDVIDFSGGKRPGPIFQLYDNVFLGGDDDGLDLDGTDAHIEGNIFTNFHYAGGEQNSTGNPIATGRSGGTTSEVTVVRNIFYDNDHATLLKEDCHMIAENNVFVGTTISVVNFDEPGKADGPGWGAYMDGNIFWNNADEFENFYPSVDLTVNRSILPEQWHYLGEGNIDAEPLFVDEQSDFHLKPASPAIGSGPHGLDMGAYVPKGAAVSGGPDELTYRTDATLNVGGPGIVAYHYRASDDPVWSSEIPVSTPIEMTDLIDGNSYTVYAIGKNSAGIWQDEANSTASRTWTVDTSHWKLIINEVLADSNDGSPDLIELYYDGLSALDMSGMGISDSPISPSRFVFGPSTVIEPNEYLVLVADGNTAVPGHLSFALDASGEGLYLYDSDSVLVDSVEFGMQLSGYSIGRVGPEYNWALCEPTFGHENVAQLLGDPDTLKINEWLTNSEVVFEADFIEIYNSHSNPVDMSGMFLTDNPVSQPYKHEIAPLSFVAGDGFAVFIADDEEQDGPQHANFRLSATHEMIGLFDVDGNKIDQVIYYSQTTNVSQGRSPDGAPDYSFFELPTPGITNVPSSGVTEALALINALCITELMYNPAGSDESKEFIELHNIGDTILDLAGVRFTDGIDFTFPPDANIPAYGYILLAKEPGVFKLLYPSVSDDVIFGPYDGQFDNGGEELILKVAEPFDAAIMRFEYDDIWYPQTDGDGFSLNILDPTADPVTWDDAESWHAAAPNPGF